jgi:hypothetical protein
MFRSKDPAGEEAHFIINIQGNRAFKDNIIATTN